jgi:hypothetical protein
LPGRYEKERVLAERAEKGKDSREDKHGENSKKGRPSSAREWLSVVQCYNVLY